MLTFLIYVLALIAGVLTGATILTVGESDYRWLLITTYVVGLPIGYVGLLFWFFLAAVQWN